MEHSQDLVRDFHAKFPDLPAPTTIRHLSLNETRLYDPDENRHGCDFTPPKPDNEGEDWILPLPREEVDTLIETCNSLEATLFPVTVKRVWIVEKESRMVDFVGILGKDQSVVHLYQLTHPPHIKAARLRKAPGHLLRDNHERRLRIW